MDREETDEVALDAEVGDQVPAAFAGARENPQEVESVPEHKQLPVGWKEIDEGKWGLELLRAMDWKLLEDLCAELFRRKGNEVEVVEPRRDDGIDFIVKTGEVEVVVLCTQSEVDFDLKQVGVFCGEAVQAGYDHMVIITSGDFTGEARDNYKNNQSVQLIGGEALLRNIDKMGEEIAAELLEMVVGDREGWQTPSCVNCGIKMELREAKELGKRFWACANFETSGCYQTIDVSG